MKKTIALAAVMAAAAAFGGVKVGTVDMALLVRSHSSYETNKELLLGTEKDYRRQIDGMKAVLDEIQEEGQKLADELRNPMLSAAAKEKAEKDLVSVQRRFAQQEKKIREEAASSQQKLIELHDTLLKSQTADIRKRIAEFAKKNGYDLVIDASAAVFAAESMDVTDAVLKEMGVDPKVARAKEKDEGK